MIIEIRMNGANKFVYSQPLNSDIAWDDNVTYFDCQNQIIYPSSFHPKEELSTMSVVAWGIYEDYKRAKA